MKRLIIGLLIILIVGAGGVFVGAYRANHSVVADVPLAAAPKDAVQPTAEFLADFADLQKLNAEVRDLEKDSGLMAKRDQARGLANRLGLMVPKGYEWHEPSRMFVPKPPLAIIPSPAPNPAPPAKK